MPIELPVCRYREAAEAGLVRCRSPRVRAPNAFPESICLRCELADKVPAADRAATPPPRLPLPCVHRGEDEMGAAWAAKTGRCPQKQWYECAKGVGGGYVCACQGCGPACQQYEPPPGGGVNT